MYKFLCKHMFSFLLGICLGVELLGHMVTFNLLRNCQTDFTFPPAMYEGSSFSTFLPMLVVVHHFDCSHCSDYKVVSHCGFDLHFPDG